MKPFNVLLVLIVLSANACGKKEDGPNGIGRGKEIKVEDLIELKITTDSPMEAVKHEKEQCPKLTGQFVSSGDSRLSFRNADRVLEYYDVGPEPLWRKADGAVYSSGFKDGRLQSQTVGESWHSTGCQDGKIVTRMAYRTPDGLNYWNSVIEFPDNAHIVETLIHRSSGDSINDLGPFMIVYDRLK